MVAQMCYFQVGLGLWLYSLTGVGFWVMLVLVQIGDGVVCWVITTEDDILGYWCSVVSIRSDMGVCVSDGDKLSGVATE